MGIGASEFALREFDRFLSGYARKDPRWQLDRAARVCDMCGRIGRVLFWRYNPNV